ncbi:30S ribosomal protein S9 [Candidatus Saccharibacteria bacterium]|nr:30S ribosomal protein S9 [Candidatus Saccharibacteria bacterium]NCU40610.1 30S ribosomal protein S9 [Candidatus Saccharibacteria bacterium]
MAKNEYFYGLGRRKSATARARLSGGKGVITINGKTAEEYLDGNSTLIAELTDPLALVSKQKNFDVSLVISGGGTSGQVDAAKNAVARALTELDETLRPALKKAGFIKRDPREKERKKYGLRSARKREQFSKR